MISLRKVALDHQEDIWKQVSRKLSGFPLEVRKDIAADVTLELLERAEKSPDTEVHHPFRAISYALLDVHRSHAMRAFRFVPTDMNYESGVSIPADQLDRLEAIVEAREDILTRDQEAEWALLPVAEKSARISEGNRGTLTLIPAG